MSRSWALWALLWPALAAGAGYKWHTMLTPHFELSHEHPWTPPGFSIGLERVHNRLRLDLAMFSPWMSKERVKLYLYKDQKSYSEGEFAPPPWSNGIAMYQKRTVVVFDQPNAHKLLEIIAHETTHLLFESYWGELGKQPPSWLNEGLAMLEEGDSAAPERSEWYRAMADLPNKRPMTLEELARINPTRDLNDDKEAVGVWYVQSYAVVHFLLRRHSRLQFKNFCGKLRDGHTLEDALWLAYRYRSLAHFDGAWARWLAEPEHQKRLAKAGVSASFDASQERKPIGAIKGFKPLGSPRELRNKDE